MRTKYFNDGLIGNTKIKASFTKTGEMIRLLYGAADYKQLLDVFNVGITVNESNLVYLHNDINNSYYQEYIENTNVLNTNIFNSYFNVRILQTDFALDEETCIVKKYKFKNENTYDMNMKFIVYSKVLTNLNNDTSGFVKDNALIQYNHDFSVCTFSKDVITSSQVNGVENNLQSGKIYGKDYIGMSSGSAICYDLGLLKPGEEREIILLIYINKNREFDVLNSIDTEIDRLNKIDLNFALENNISKWKKFVTEHDKLGINNKNINPIIKEIYNRSILLFPLLINNSTGGISAGIEVDEDKTKCGRYSYCWPRDAAFITKAFDIVSMEEETEKFYNKFCKITQSTSGRWEQRFYTDGRLAPAWGFQIDETASVIYGIYEHYKNSRNKEFLVKNFDMLEKAIKYIEEYLKDIFDETFKLQVSYDLWEEFEGISLYSLSACFAGLKSMQKIYMELKEVFQDNNEKLDYLNKEIEIIDKFLLRLNEYSFNKFYDDYKKSFVRNLKDRKIDISILGTIVPFQMFDLNNEKVKDTIDKINMTLRTYTGGYVRYEDDSYMGGYNPWPIATLWMAWYYLEANEIDEALKLFEFVTSSASSHGYLGEQVNNDAMKPSWVIGLTWSHAMYLILLDKLLEKGIL